MIGKDKKKDEWCDDDAKPRKSWRKLERESNKCWKRAEIPIENDLRRVSFGGDGKKEENDIVNLCYTRY